MGRERRKKTRVKGTSSVIGREEFDALALEDRVALIQELIPIGLMAAAAELQREVEELAGSRYGREDAKKGTRFGSNPGTVLLGGQKVPIRVPRVRTEEGEIPLKSYELLHREMRREPSLLHRVLHGISCREEDRALPRREGSIGTSKSSVSRKFVRASGECLGKVEQRDLSSLDIVAIFLDGKVFAGDVMVVALGIDLSGKKHILGFIHVDDLEDA